MPLFLSILYLAALGALFGHIARKYTETQSTNRRWIVILLANGVANALLPSSTDHVSNGLLFEIAIVAAMFIVSVRVFGRVSWLMACVFFGLYIVISVIAVVVIALLFGPEVFA